MVHFRGKDLSPGGINVRKPQSKSLPWRFKENNNGGVCKGVFICQSAFRCNEQKTDSDGFAPEDLDLTLE